MHGHCAEWTTALLLVLLKTTTPDPAPHQRLPDLHRALPRHVHQHKRKHIALYRMRSEVPCQEMGGAPGQPLQEGDQNHVGAAAGEALRTAGTAHHTIPGHATPRHATTTSNKCQSAS
jgi:hypothetical protein